MDAYWELFGRIVQDAETQGVTVMLSFGGQQSTLSIGNYVYTFAQNYSIPSQFPDAVHHYYNWRITNAHPLVPAEPVLETAAGRRGFYGY